ncbi:class I SAM-dependent methyltransferase [archaeon]|nr:class I SAM-dependent methyltransferase [archaeon]
MRKANVERDWERVYEEHATPWDVGQADELLTQLVESGRVNPVRALELGCGHGNDSIFLASKGFDVTGVDISSRAIQEARKRASRAGVKCNFIVEDATRLGSVKGKFGFIYDRACFHFIPQERWSGYISNVKRLLADDGLFVLVVSSENDPVTGPYGFSENDIIKLFGGDFDIEEIKLITLKTHALKPKPYFCVMRKKKQ